MIHARSATFGSEWEEHLPRREWILDTITSEFLTGAKREEPHSSEDGESDSDVNVEGSDISDNDA